MWTRWERSGGYWVEDPCRPSRLTAGAPPAGQRRSPERVFFDGEPLEQVGSDPVNGQFAVDAKREAWLADYPANHTVEVTTRMG